MVSTFVAIPLQVNKGYY